MPLHQMADNSFYPRIIIATGHKTANTLTPPLATQFSKEGDTLTTSCHNTFHDMNSDDHLYDVVKIINPCTAVVALSLTH